MLTKLRGQLGRKAYKISRDDQYEKNNKLWQRIAKKHDNKVTGLVKKYSTECNKFHNLCVNERVKSASGSDCGEDSMINNDTIHCKDCAEERVHCCKVDEEKVKVENSTIFGSNTKNEDATHLNIGGGCEDCEGCCPNKKRGRKYDSEDSVNTEHSEVVNGVKYSNEDIGTNKKEEWDVMVYGNITLSKEEKKVLSKRPEFALFGKLDRLNIIKEIEMGYCKLRWERRKTGYKEVDERTDEEKSEAEAVSNAIEAMTRQVYCRTTNTLDTGAKKATDSCHNQRVHLSTLKTCY